MFVPMLIIAKVEINQISISLWMDKQNVKFPSDGMLFSNEEKQTH